MDASVVLKVLWMEEESPLARSIFDRWPGGAAAPALLAYEVANVVRHNRALSPRLKSEAMDSFHALGIALHPPELCDLQEAIRVGAARGVTAYDASYLVLARKLGRNMVTADARFASRVAASDVLRLRDLA